MRWSCVRTSSLLGLRPGGVPAADRLALEDHLASCVACRETAALSDALRDLTLAAPSTIRAGAIEQAVTRGLAAAGEPAPVAPSRRWIWIPAAAAAAALVVVWVGRSRVSLPTVEVRVPEVTPPAPPPADRVASGRVVMGGRELAPGAALSPAQPLLAESDAELVLGRATLRTAAGSELSFADPDVVMLSTGRLEIEVTPTPGRSFRVATERFVVEVVGTRFAVSVHEVAVFAGRVRVLDPAGAPLAELGAGESWRPLAASAPREMVAAPVRLARVRRHLAAHDVGAAKRELSALAGMRLPRRQEAEAATLRAECAVVEGKSEEAIRQYLVVAERWADLPAGESALFAAARQADRAGRAAEARELLGRYLERHPKGQFQREARDRLRRLTESR